MEFSADMLALLRDLQAIRAEAPLVHHITNWVAMNTNANVVLAVGGSPIMAHAEEELEALLAIAKALVINIGTLDRAFIHSMQLALKYARARQLPVVLDPVGAGASSLRTDTVRSFLEQGGITVLRGNASEIAACAGEKGHTKGVDSTQASESAYEAALALSKQYGCTVVVSGASDYVVSKDAHWVGRYGHPLMTRVTTMGCAATSLVGAFLAVQSHPLQAAKHAMMVMGMAGSLAAEKSEGPGSLWVHFLDGLYTLDAAHIQTCWKES